MFSYSDLFAVTAKGQTYLADRIKLLVYQAENELFRQLDFNNDKIFLEPLLFAYFTSKNKQSIRLAQILFGYLENDKRPESIEVYADDKGVIHLPNIGYFLTPLKKENAQLLYDRASGGFEIWRASKQVAYRFEKPLKVPGTSIEVCLYLNPFYTSYFAEWNDETKDFENFGTSAEIQETTRYHYANLVKAFALLKAHSYNQYTEYRTTTRRIVLFHNPKIRNFAVRDLHGTIFIGAKPEHSEIYFLEEIAHQCAHNAFNAITANLSEHFLIDPETPLIKYSKREGEFRSIYSALHGLYTIAARMDCYDKCMDALGGQALHELSGRFGDLRRRFRNGLEELNFTEVFTPFGYEVYRALDEYCEHLFFKRQDLIDKFDYSNQTMDFCYEKFTLLNSPSAFKEAIKVHK